MVSRFGGSSLGLAYSIVLTDAVIAPAFPSNTARGGVLYPVVLSVAQGAGSKPEDPEGRRLGAYLMFCGMASLAVSSALWMTATSANPIGVQVARQFGVDIGFGKWLLTASVPALLALLLLPLVVAKLFSPGTSATPDAPAAARAALAGMGPLSRAEWITAATFVLMVSGWIAADSLKLNVTSIAFAGLGVLLMTNVLTLDDITMMGDTLATFLWLAVLFALSGQLNELGFMSYAGGRLAMHLGGLSWPTTYVTLIVLYVAIHYLFVSQSSQVLALMGVFLDVGVRGGVPAPLMAFALLFASSYFSVITPQGGSQNVIFVASGYLTQRELYRLGLLMTLVLPRGVHGGWNAMDLRRELTPPAVAEAGPARRGNRALPHAHVIRYCCLLPLMLPATPPATAPIAAPVQPLPPAMAAMPAAGRGADRRPRHRSLLLRRHRRAADHAGHHRDCRNQSESFHVPSPLLGLLQSGHHHLEPDDLDDRTLHLVGVGRVPLVEPFPHRIEAVAATLQSLDEPRDDALRVGRRGRAMVRRLDLEDVGDSHDVGLLHLIGGLGPMLAGDERNLVGASTARRYRQCQARGEHQGEQLRFHCHRLLLKLVDLSVRHHLAARQAAER